MNKDVLHMAGKKDDQDKPDCSLLLDFSRALTEVAMVGTSGARKYVRDGWKTVPDAHNRYLAAMMRHLFKHNIEGPLDSESRLSHLSHAAWNALAVLELSLKEKVDDECSGKEEGLGEDEQGDASPCVSSPVPASGFNHEPYYKDAWGPRGEDDNVIHSVDAGCLAQCGEIASRGGLKECSGSGTVCGRGRPNTESQEGGDVLEDVLKYGIVVGDVWTTVTGEEVTISRVDEDEDELYPVVARGVLGRMYAYTKTGKFSIGLSSPYDLQKLVSREYRGFTLKPCDIGGYSVGDYAVTREGNMVGPFALYALSRYPITYNKLSWMTDGRYYSGFSKDSRDLVGRFVIVGGDSTWC